MNTTRSYKHHLYTEEVNKKAMGAFIYKGGYVYLVFKREGCDEVMCPTLKRRIMSEHKRANIATLRNGTHYCVKASFLI